MLVAVHPLVTKTYDRQHSRRVSASLATITIIWSYVKEGKRPRPWPELWLGLRAHVAQGAIVIVVISTGSSTGSSNSDSSAPFYRRGFQSIEDDQLCAFAQQRVCLRLQPVQLAVFLILIFFMVIIHARRRAQQVRRSCFARCGNSPACDLGNVIQLLRHELNCCTAQKGKEEAGGDLLL